MAEKRSGTISKESRWFTIQDRMPRWKLDEARRMRKEPTPAEAALWAALRRRQFGVRWKRQQPMFGYIADFWCPSSMLVLEVDGNSHATVKRQREDAVRDRALLRYGVRTLRLSNEQVLTDLPGALALIRSSM
jgi:guanylate kinase